MVVLKCHKANPFAQVDGLPVRLPAPNTVIRQGPGNRQPSAGLAVKTL